VQAFVAGGTGLIGRHLVQALRARDWDVVVLTRDRSRATEATALGATVVEGDLTRPRFEAQLARSDVVFHSAGWIDLGVRDAQGMFDVNVNGTATLLAAARRERVPRIVYTGTAGVFAPAPPDRPATEASPPNAVTHDPYVVTKFRAHQLVVGEMHAGLPVTIVLPAAVFGPWDTNTLGRSLAMLAKGRLGTLPRGFGLNTWTHAADVAEGLVLAATTGRPGEVYVVGDRILSLYEFYRRAADAAGVKPPVPRIPMSLGRVAARFTETWARLRGRTPYLSRAALDLAALDLCVDASKARTELGWRPRPLEDRIQETMAWYVKRYRADKSPLPVKPGGASAGGPVRRA